MTIEQSWEEADEYQEQGADAWSDRRPVPVLVQNQQVQNVAPEATSWMTYQVPVAGQVSQLFPIAPHRYHRYKAKFLWIVPAGTTIWIARTPDALTGNALANVFSITVATAITTSQQLTPDYDGQQPVYCVASQAGVVVSVMDEGFKEVQ